MKIERWQRNLCFLWIAQTVSITGFSFAIPFAPLYLQDLGVTDPKQLRLWSGLFSSIAGLTMTIMTPFWGYLADRFGRKPMTLRASLGGAVALLGMGLVRTPEMLLLFRLIQGAFTGTITAFLTLAVAESPKERTGFVVSVMNSAVFLGTAIAPLIGGALADHFGFRLTFLISAGLLFLSFLLSVFFIHERAAPQQQMAFSFWADTKAILTIRGVASIMGMIFLYSACRNIHQPVLPLFIQDISTDPGRLGAQTGLVSSLAGVASVAAAVVMGIVIDRGRWGIGTMSAFVAALFASGLFFAQTVWQLALLYSVTAMFIGGIDPLLKVMLTRSVPQAKSGSAFGLSGSAISCGWFFGSLSGGMLAAIMGLRPVFLVIGVFLAAIAVLLTKLVRKVRREKTNE
ncbi:major facilitator superfamily MFS_1 [Candidatus Moduliflexus flocculans]|uniref:Major facilitator superfamily MFS_1 n=1 Tax=Candidatus Moduliflexus flocculans TaxID=1499966 RepID=A0A0S6W3Y5_9BACT|nr:major facilitator superfamily MFS_1 [Candidatus Moduliflexus flocculans]